MAVEIFGREVELASVRGFVGRPEGGLAALVLEGEAGIGKSTLWLAAVEHARSLGLRVLAARPAEAESSLAHAGLGDLFEDVLDDVLPRLSPPRRRALDAALLLEDASPDPVDPRALGIAVRDALQGLAKQQPPVVAIDDLQWLDAASAAALAFAFRRMDEIPVRLLLARRRLDGAQPSELEQALPDANVQRVSLGPLSVGALHTFLRNRLGRVFARQTLLRVHEHSGGNPFFALEVARALGPDVDPTQPLPVPQTLEELVRARLRGLPRRTRDALALASAAGTPSESLLASAGVASDALAPAIAGHIVKRDRGAIRFTHPLLSSVLYKDLGAERRVVHERLAAIIPDPVMRGRHLALATDKPDTAVAAALDDASAIANARGAAATAAELAEAALRLTPSGAVGERHRRGLAAARAHRTSGEWTRARKIVSDLLEQSGLGALRAEALLLLAELESLDRAVALLEEALHEAAARPELQALIQCRLAWSARFTKGFDGGLEHARASLALADEVGSDELRVEALAMMAFLGSAVGDPETPAYAARAHEIAAGTADARLLRTARFALADTIGSLQRSRALLEREYEECRERDDLSAAQALHSLAWLELRAGRWELAADYADRAYDLMTQYGLEVPWAHLPIAIVAAHRGQLELARAHSERALQLGEEQFGGHTPVHVATLGFVALQSGDPKTALRWFAEAEGVTTRLGWHEARHRWWVPDHVEALLELDRVDDAARVLEAWEAERRAGDDRTLASVGRCRGLIASARGDINEAAALFEDALARHEHTADSFGRARTLLALGVVRRRQRQKRSAREAIAAALQGFEQLGAATWVEKARAELGRIGGRRREQGLTAAERRVAALVAEGRTNREVAAALFLGERTVETHLSHIYAKLGVRSRAGLARVYGRESEAAEQSSGGLAISS